MNSSRGLACQIKWGILSLKSTAERSGAERLKGLLWPKATKAHSKPNALNPQNSWYLRWQKFDSCYHMVNLS